MAAIQRHYALVVFQQLYFVDIVHSSRRRQTFMVESIGNVHRIYAPSIDDVTVAEQFGQRSTVFLVDIARRPIRSHCLIRLGVDSLV